MICLKHKKFINKELEKVDGAELLLQKTILGIEQAQADIQVFEALKLGDKVLKELRSHASTEQFEELFDDHQDKL